MPSVTTERYTTVAMVLHWAIAISIIGLIVAGVWMVDAIKQPDTRAAAFNIYQLHKSLGLTVLLLSVVRLAWRLTHRSPPLPAGMTPFQRTAAHSTHILFYVFMIGMPLAGWAMVSASKLGLPTIVFGQFEWPHIVWIETLEIGQKAAAEAAFKATHKYMGYMLAALLVLHVGAALKHHFVDRDGVLARMVPGLRPRDSHHA
ncbi:MAG: cytochrome b [Hyphomicrobiaceae bacterium]|nr:cytochrome b [Hyphomicrobiaceae bacterium]